MKGLAAAIGEALEAGAARRARRPLRRHSTDARRCRRRLLATSSRQRPPRAPADEMAAARAMLDELGVEPRIAPRARPGCGRFAAPDG
jgi:hypothetical protein